MVQLQSKGKEKKQQSDYAEHLIFKIDNKHVKKSLTMKKENSPQQHKLQICIHHSPLQHLEDYLWVQKPFCHGANDMIKFYIIQPCYFPPEHEMCVSL